MPDGITQWEFTGDGASWINEILTINEDLPFSRARCEKRSDGSQKRRDLTLLDDNGKAVLAGEIKLPYRPQGGSPYNHAVVKDAHLEGPPAELVVQYWLGWIPRSSPPSSGARG